MQYISRLRGTQESSYLCQRDRAQIIVKYPYFHAYNLLLIYIFRMESGCPVGYTRVLACMLVNHTNNRYHGLGGSWNCSTDEMLLFTLHCYMLLPTCLTHTVRLERFHVGSLNKPDWSKIFFS